MTMNRIFLIGKDGKLSSLASLAEALEAKRDGIVWFDYCDPTRDDLEPLIEPLGLHPLAVEDCLDDNQIPKIEDYPNHCFILFNAFHYQEKALAIHEVDLFIGDQFLVTVSKADLEHNSPLKDVEKIIHREIETARLGPAFLAHIILDVIVDQKFTAIEGLEDQLDHTEDLILADHERFVPADLVNLRRELLSVRKSLFHEREVLVRINRKDTHFIPETSLLYYRDIYDHLAKFFELTESARDLVTGLMEMYLSIINNKMTMAANETNVTVRRLTFITTIFMPLSLLAGIGGMSEWSMMTGPQNWRIAYPLFLLAMVVIGIANYYLLKLLERKRQRKD